MIQQKRVQRGRVVRRIEAAHRERANRTEEHAASVRKYEETVAKLEAKKGTRHLDDPAGLPSRTARASLAARCCAPALTATGSLGGGAAMRDQMLKSELERDRLRTSEVLHALYKSQIAPDVISDNQLDGVIAGPSAKKK